jgi:hypothetical protein
VDCSAALGVCTHPRTDWHRRQQHVSLATLLFSLSDQFVRSNHFARIFLVFFCSRSRICRCSTSSLFPAASVAAHHPFIHPLCNACFLKVCLFRRWCNSHLGLIFQVLHPTNLILFPPRFPLYFITLLSFRRSESSSLISLIHLRRTCTAISLMNRRKILIAAAGPLGDEQGAQLQLWDWTSPCVLFSLQSTVKLHCISVSPLDTSMKGLGCDGR